MRPPLESQFFKVITATNTCQSWHLGFLLVKLIGALQHTNHVQRQAFVDVFTIFVKFSGITEIACDTWRYGSMAFVCPCSSAILTEPAGLH